MPYTITTCLAVSQGITCIGVIRWYLLDCRHGWRLYIQFIVFGFGVFSSRVTTAVPAVSLLLLQPKDLSKTISTTFLLYFSIILPAIAFDNLQVDNTDEDINVEKILVGQVCRGLIFSILAGQPLVVVMTTAPLVLFTKIILLVAKDYEFSFLSFFAMVGLWNSFLLQLVQTYEIFLSVN